MQIKSFSTNVYHLADYALSQAARLGLDPGVIIVEVNSNTIEKVSDLKKTLKSTGPRGWNIILNHHGRPHRLIIR